MAGAVIGALRVMLGIDTAAFEDGVGIVQKKLAATGKSITATGQKIATAGAFMSAGITAPLLAAGAAALKGAQDQAQAMAQVNAALASMGPVAGRTAEQLLAASDALEMNSLADGDEILRKVTANLLTFGNIAGAVFDRTQQLAADVAQRMGGDLQGAALMLGKALNDPAKGLASLSRVGIQFTEQQKEQIKAMAAAGDTAGAQAIMLGELERQFGGAAKAAADTDPWRKAQVAIGQAGDVIGEALLPIIPPIANGIAAIATAFGSLPPGVQTTVVVVAALGAALGPVLIGIGAMVSAIGTILPMLGILAAATGGVAAAEGAAAVAAYGLGAAIGIALGPIAAIAGAVALAVAAFNHWDEIKAVTSRVVGYVSAMVRGVGEWVTGKLLGILRSVAAPIKQVGDWFFTLYDRVVGHSYIPDMVDEIGDHMRRLDANMVNPARQATDAAAQAFQALQSRVSGILDRIFPDQARFNQLKSELSDLAAYAKKVGWSPAETDAAMTQLRREAGGVNTSRTGIDLPTPDRIPLPDLSKETEDMARRVTAANNNVVESFAGLARDVVGSLGNLTRSIKSGDWLSALGSVLDVIGQISGLIKGTGKPAARTYSTGGSIPGFATGGSFVVNGMRGIDKNLLSMNGRPIARVSHGETIGVGRGGGGGAVEIVPSPWFDVRARAASSGDVQSMGVQAAAGGARLAASDAAKRSRRRLG